MALNARLYYLLGPYALAILVTPLHSQVTPSASEYTKVKKMTMKADEIMNPLSVTVEMEPGAPGPSEMAEQGSLVMVSSP